MWDYTQRLAQALARQGVAVDTYNAADWSPRGIAELWKVIRTPGRIVHLQHPSAAFEGRAFPYFIPLAALGRSPVVTIHEFTRKRKAGKVLAIALFVFARHLIFTTATERDAACRYFPPIRSKTSIIPIASNIPLAPPRPWDTDLAYFGIIRPHKGVEEFLDVVERIDNRALKVRLIGQVPPDFTAYAAELFVRADKLGVELVLDRSDEDVAMLLSGVNMMLLPFPDGISVRRGSAIAAMANGALVATTPALKETATFRDICVTGNTTAEFAELVRANHSDPAQFAAQREGGRLYARSLDWDGISESHRALYRQLAPQG
ncbi:MAG TPA: glycosyltransferase [Xanthobacteraceae bacterium]|nr:glycosyltransferase [Xanthobacteraceae bacterium]